MNKQKSDFCSNCQKQMEFMKPLYFHTGKSWFGCKDCDIVVEQSHCSVTGAEHGCKRWGSYASYKKMLARRAKGDQK